MKKELLVLLIGIVLSTNSFGVTQDIEKKRMSFGQCTEVHLKNVASFSGGVQMRFIELKMDALLVRYCTKEADGSTVLFACMNGYMEIVRSSERGECP